MSTRKRTRFVAFLMVSLCLALAAPALADTADEGQDPPDSTQPATTTTQTAEALVLDLATSTVNLLLQVTLL